MMSDLTVRRWAGGLGAGSFVVFLVALPLYFVGMTDALRRTPSGSATT